MEACISSSKSIREDHDCSQVLLLAVPSSAQKASGQRTSESVKYLLHTAHKLNIVGTHLTQVRIQPEVRSAPRHHGLQLIAALRAEAGVLPAGFQAVLDGCVSCKCQHMCYVSPCIMAQIRVCECGSGNCIDDCSLSNDKGQARFPNKTKVASLLTGCT